MKQKRVDERLKKQVRKKLKRRNVVSAVAGGDTVVVNETITNVTNVTTGVSNLDELNDVVLADYPADGDVLTYDSVTSKWVNEQPTASGGGHTIQDEGTPLTQRTNLNFVGSAVTVTDDAGNNATVVTITGGGGTPGGSDTQVQYNNAGAFAGISGATTNGTILNVTTAGSGTNTTQAASTEFVQQEITTATSGTASSYLANKVALYLFNAY